MRKFYLILIFFCLFTTRGYSQCTIHPTILTEWNCTTVTGRILAVVLSGGVPPYIYTLDFGTPQSSYIFNNVPSGNHHIKIQDALCSVEYDLTLTPNSNLSAGVNLSEIGCGKITVEPYSGYPPYLLSINGGTFQSSAVFSNLVAGTYNIVVKDAAGCTIAVPPVIITTNPLTASTTKVNTLCPGSNSGSITLTANNGTAPYLYSIDGGVSYQSSNIFTGLGAGIYQFIVKDFNNCKLIKTDTIVNGLSGVSATVSTQNTACSGSATGSITITPNAGLAPFTYTFGGNTQNSNTFTSLLAGNYSIVITDANGCNITITAIVGNNPGINASLTTSAAACSGSATGSITVTSATGISPYTYSLNNLPQQSSNTFPGLSAGGYTVNVTDGNGCSVSLPAVVDNGVGISATSITQNASCSSVSNGSITVTPNLGLMPYSYSLDGGVFQGSNFFNNILPGNHAMIVKDANNCSYSFTSIVNSDPGVTATFNAQNSACPASATGSITITAALGVVPYSYSLNGSAFQSSNIYTGLTAGNYTIIVNDAVGCSFSGSYPVNSNPGVTATSSSVNTACGTATTGSITITASGGNAPYTYSLDGGTFQLLNVFTGLASGPHSIVVKDAVGCIFTGTESVASNSGVTATSLIINAGCPGSATGRITINASAGVAPYEYSLDGAAFQFSNVFSGLLGNSYTLKVKDSAGCLFNFNAIVNNDPLLTATLNIAEPSCFGTATGSLVINTFLGRAPYKFALDNSAYQPGNTFVNLIRGSYMIHIKDANGCIKDTSVILNQPAPLSAITDTIASTCIANDGTITVTASGGTSSYLYSSNNGNNYQASNILKVSPGTYNVVVKDNQGCLFSTLASVTLIDDMFLDIGNDTTSCYGIPVTITPRTNSGTNIFNWTPAGGNLNTLTGAYTVSPSDTTPYVLTASYGVCQRTDNLTINVLRKPIAHAGNDTIICDKSSAFLHGSASNLSGSVNYLWSPSIDVNSEVTDTTTVKPTTLGPHTYTLQVSDNYGCNFKVTDAMVVTMNQIPVAFAGNDTIAAMNLPHQLLGKGGLSCAWSSGSVLNNPYTKNPVAILSRDTKFILTVYDNAGCSGTDTVLVKVYQGPTYYVPNAFTPNNDGLNDVFKAIPPGITKTDYFRIYNRWGQLIFETHQYLKGWDGTFVGKPQPNGSYVWHIKGIDKFGKVVEMSGSVVLIR